MRVRSEVRVKVEVKLRGQGQIPIFRIVLPSAAKGNYPQVLSKGVPLPVCELCLFVCNQTAYANNLTGVVDRLLITSGVCVCGGG